MSDKTESLTEVDRLKGKLEAAISARTTLESDFKSQTALLTKFIGKLSQTCKGIDLELDNKLADFRVLLSKPCPIEEIETQVGQISQLLQQHSKVNELHMHQMHEQFQLSGQTLQKTNGLPNTLRRELREFIEESSSSKDALIQYVPLLSRLIEFYDTALKSKTDIPKGGLLGSINQANKNGNAEVSSAEEKKLVKKAIKLINRLELSSENDKKLRETQLNLDSNLPLSELIGHFITVFELILLDLEQERETSRAFLSTLSNTLSTVQYAVDSTIETTKDTQKKNDKLNSQLSKQINEMSNTVNDASSLSKMKSDIKEKLSKISSIVELKASFEKRQQTHIEEQLASMKAKVDKLEKQGEKFKKQLEEQQVKSMQDALTKLHNRAAFDEYFSKQMVRYHHTPFDLSLVVMDLDDFKRINDTYGHTAGDKTLQVIANTLAKKLPKDAFIARYGGEEFVIVFSNLDKENLMMTLNKLKASISKLPFKFKNNKVSITTSMGACHINSDDNIHIAFERADTALYEAKAQGKNQAIYAE